MKDLVEVLAPTRNRIFVGFRIGEPRDRTTFTLADDLPLDLSYSPAIKILVRGVARRTHYWFDLPGQFLDGPENRRAEILWLPPIQSPVEGFAYCTARRAEVGVILIIRRRILGDVSRKLVAVWGERTLIVVKRAPTELKAALAGGIRQLSSAKLKAWMSASNTEIGRSRFFCRREAEAIVEGGGECEGCEGEVEP